MEKKTVLKIEDLAVSYGEQTILSGISFELREGQILCIAGERGCGKSTLLKAVLRFPEVCIEKGSVSFMGNPIRGSGLYAEHLGTGIGLVRQEPLGAFNPIRRFDVQIKETLASHGMAMDWEQIVSLLTSLGLPEPEKILKSCPYELSIGMNQRMSVAAAMLLRPVCLLCDEPTSALDTVSTAALREQLKKLNRAFNTAILLVTHDLRLGKRLADQMGILYQGKLVEYAATEKIFENPEHEYTRLLLDSLRMES